MSFQGISFTYAKWQPFLHGVSHRPCNLDSIYTGMQPEMMAEARLCDVGVSPHWMRQ